MVKAAEAWAWVGVVLAVGMFTFNTTQVKIEL